MKVTFILPAIGKEEGKKYIRTWKMEPLMIAYLKSLTPPGIETEFFDDRIELIDYDTKTDLVAITLETYTANRGYRIAGKFRERGTPVVFGGHHATHMPEEAALHGDSVLSGEAEGIWKTVLEDAEAKRLKKFYKANDKDFSWISPDKSIYGSKKYTPLTLIETSRGCCFNCEFCSVAKFYNYRYKSRPIKDVAAEIEKSGKKHFFIIDDNFIGNIDHTKELLKALIPLNIRWASQGTLNMAQDDELLGLLKESGCVLLLIGFESMDPHNLEQMNKKWMTRLGERDKLVQKIHDHGINIYATFVFGYDNDTPDTFKMAVDFSLTHRLFFAAFNHLLPWPGTPLYQRLEKENKLVLPEWWLDESAKYGDYFFSTGRMTHEELRDNCANARREFFLYSNIFKRGLKLFKRNPQLLMFYLFFTQNTLLRREIEKRLRLPIGTGLDAMPK